MAVRGDNSLFFSTGIDNSGLLKGKIQAESIIQSLGSTISKINPFAALAVGAIAAFAVIANGALKMSKSFESAMAEVKTIANVSEGAFNKLKQEVFEIYKQLGTEPPDKLANGLYEIIGAGFEAGDALKVLEISSKAATAGVTTTAVAADGLTTILNAFKLSTQESQEVADIMFATVDRGKISFEELSSNIATVAPLAASSSISFEEIGAAIATLTKQGVPASVAMTQIRSAIIATNEVLGDGAFKTLTLQEGLQKMYESADGSQNKLKELAGRIEAVNGIIGLAGENFKGATEDLDAMANSAGSVDRSFKIITSTNANQWEIFRNRMKASTEGIGNAVLNMSNSIVGSLNKILDGNKSVTDSYVDQKRKLNDLIFEYNDSNTSLERRQEILGELKKINPAIVSGLGTEKDKYILLNDRLSDYNDLLSTRISLERELNNIEELNVEKNDKTERLYDLDNAAKKSILDLSNEYRNGNIKFYEDVAAKFEDVLKGDYDDNFKKLEALNKIIFDSQSSLSGNTKNRNIANRISKEYLGFGGGSVKDFRRIKKEIENINKSITSEQEEINSKILFDLKGKEDYIIGLLETYKSLDRVSKEIGVDVSLVDDSDVKKIVEFRKITEKTVNEISKIKQDDYKKNKNILKEYLDSENEEIRKAAQKRKDVFNFKPSGKSLDDDRTEIEIFEDNLKTKEQQFKAFNLAVKNDDKQLAFDLRENYKIKEDDYVEYLQNIYKITQNDGEKALILGELDKQGSGVINREKAVAIETQTIPVNLDIKIDTTSVNAIKRRLSKLNKTYEKAQSDSERKIISIKINSEQKKLDNAEKYLKKEQNLYEDLKIAISDLNVKELRDYKTYWVNKLDAAEKGTDAYIAIQNKIALANGKINEKLLSQSSELFSEVASLFKNIGDDEMSNLVSQVGNIASAFTNTYSVLNDENSSTLQKASGIVSLISQAGVLIKNIGKGDYNKELDAQRQKNSLIAEQLTYERKINNLRKERNEIERNSSAFFDSYYKDDFLAAVDTEVEATERLDKALKDLSKNGVLSAEGKGKRLLFGSKTERRSFSISDILGGKDIPEYFATDPFKDGKTARSRFFDPLSIMGGYSDLKVEKDALKNLQKAFEDTLSAMGKTSSDMAKFSTENWLDFFTALESTGHITDEGTKKILEEAKIALQEYQDAVEEMKSIISEFAGTLGSSLSDALVSAFNDGTDAADNFAKSVNDVMTNLFLNELIQSQFKPFFDDLQKEMEESFGAGGDQSWIDDIKRFSEGVGPAMDGAIEAMQVFNDELEAQGYDGFGSDDTKRNGLSGAISTITEDTANVLAGTLNSIRIDIANGLGIAQNSSLYLSQIVVNTSYNKHLEIMAIRLQNIETLLT